jgi:hypothetical protein
VLIAECLFSKIVQCITFSLWSESLTLPFVRFYVKQKRPFLAEKVSASRGGAGIYACGDIGGRTAL